MRRVLLIIMTAAILIVIYNFVFASKRYTPKNQVVKDCNACLVKDEEVAVDLAEDTLFSAYGTSKIKSERPYSVQLIGNEIWLLKGSLNHGILDRLLFNNVPQLGGTFEVKINSKDGKVILLTHYK